MSFDKLEDHLWSYILGFLTSPGREALSGLTKQEAINEPTIAVDRLPDGDAPGVTRRRDIRAPELCVLMRTSIAFNVLASIPLYRNVITDDLTTLVNFLGGPPAHPRIESKAQLLHHTRQLSLEYKRKGIEDSTVYDLPYTMIMADQYQRSWGSVGRSATDTAMLQSAQEISRLAEGALLFPPRDYYGTPFPSLTRLTVGKIFGPQEGLWGFVRKLNFLRYTANGGTNEAVTQDLIAACNQAMIAIFSRSPITHFCQRGHSGPLSLPRAFHWLDSFSTKNPPTSPLFTVHYTVDVKTTRMPAAIDGRTQWLLEGPIPGEHVERLLKVMNEAFLEVRQERDAIWSDPKTRRDKRKHPTFDITLYGNSLDLPDPSAPSRHDDEQSLIARMNNLLKMERGESPIFEVGEVDKNRWRLSAESPPCEACGWTWEEAAGEAGRLVEA